MITAGRGGGGNGGDGKVSPQIRASILFKAPFAAAALKRHRTLSLARFWHPALEDSSVDVASQPRPTSLIHLESCSCNFVDGLDE